MDKKDFVTYEQAISLRNLGFKEACLYNYDIAKNLMPNVCVGHTSTIDMLISHNLDSAKRIDAPLLYHAQSWLRKSSKYYTFPFLNEETNDWSYTLVDSNGTTFNVYKHLSYEEALSAGITECLQLLESKI